MKRDARLGLAIILLVGLSVTFLVARALQNRDSMKAQRDGNVGTQAGLEESARPPVNQRDLEAPRLPHESYENTPAGGAGTGNSAMDAFLADHNPPPTPQPDRRERLERFDSPTVADRGTTPLVAPSPIVRHTTPIPQLPTLGPPAPIHPVTPITLVTPIAQVQRTYTVAEGDNPWRISNKVYGNGKYAPKIMEANKGVDARRLKIGQKLIIPTLKGVSATVASGNRAPSPTDSANRTRRTPRTARIEGEAAGPSTAAVQLPTGNRVPQIASSEGYYSYVVKSGDVLGRIAKTYYGYSGSKSVERIIAANPGLTAKSLQVGETIKIPARERVVASRAAQ